MGSVDFIVPPEEGLPLDLEDMVADSNDLFPLPDSGYMQNKRTWMPNRLVCDECSYAWVCVAPARKVGEFECPSCGEAAGEQAKEGLRLFFG